MASITVGLVGATGNIGNSIVKGLLGAKHAHFQITALTRPDSLEKATTLYLATKGVKIVAVDLTGPQDALVDALLGLDVVIVCLPPSANAQQIPLIKAAAAAKVKRFVPNSWAVVAPTQDIMIRDWKEEVYSYMKKCRLPYTIIDTGVWHEVVIPKVPSGNFDHAALMGKTFLVGDGDTDCATTAIKDIGPFVARIIADPRTLNTSIFAYGEHVTPKDYIALAQKITGEKAEVVPITKQQVLNLAHQPESEAFGV